MANTVFAVVEARGVAITEKFAYGEVVPMPIIPVFATMKLVKVVEPITNDGFPRSISVSSIESLPHGEVVPKPELLLAVTMNDVLVVEPTTNAGAPNASPVGLTDKRPHGLEVE